MPALWPNSAQQILVPRLLASAWGRGGRTLVATKSWGRVSAIGAAPILIAALLPRDAQAVYVLAVAALATAIVQRVTCRRVSDPGPWRWFVLAGALFVAGNAIMVVWKVATDGSAPLPSPADPFFLFGYGALLTGEALLVRRRSSQANGDNAIDALMVTTLVGVALWAFVLSPVLIGSNLLTSERTLEVIYSVLDLAVIAGAARLAVGSGLRVDSPKDVAYGCLRVRGMVRRAHGCLLRPRAAPGMPARRVGRVCRRTDAEPGDSWGRGQRNIRASGPVLGCGRSPMV